MNSGPVDKKCDGGSEDDTSHLVVRAWPVPIYIQVACAAVLGILAGCIFRFDDGPGGRPDGPANIFFYWLTKDRRLLEFTLVDLDIFAKVIIQLLTGLATPLIFFAIIDAFVKSEISGRQGMKLIGICLFNVTVAFAIGLTIINVFQPAAGWTKLFPELVAEAAGDDVGKLSVTQVLQRDVPRSVIEPFVNNNIMSVVILALLTGFALRSMRGRLPAAMTEEMAIVEKFASGLFTLFMRLLQYVVLLMPIVVFCALSSAVSQKGLEIVLRMLGTFLGAILGGMALHALVYYPLASWLIGGKSPWQFFRAAAPAAGTGLSLNSSLATVPVTLASLKKLGVSESSSRLAACVGTNFNNDGISLYEAMTALFLAQAIGYELSLGQQILVMLAALSVCLGSAGVPSSGMIILPLVLKSAGLPPAVITNGVGLVQSVDWIAARCRSAVNVMGDITVAILLDAGKKR